MYYSGLYKCDIANGDGVRVVLWCSGCTLHCPNCHNPKEQDFNNGQVFDEEVLQELLAALDHEYIDGLTLSGGHPLEQPNVSTVNYIVDKVKIYFPEKTIWIYSGLTGEEIKKVPEYFNIVKKCDILVDGKFIEELKDISLQFRGSSNQRIIDVQETLKQNKIIMR